MDSKNNDIQHIKDLTFDPNNARRHNPRNIGMIERSLNEVGAGRSIVVDEDGIILAGNGLVEAAAQAGISRVRVIEADGNEIIAVRRRGLTAEQKTKLALFDNRTAELAEWEPGVLAGLADIDLSSLFTPQEFAELSQPALSEPGGGGDEFDPTPVEGETRTALGQLWSIGGKHRLYVGDCTDPANVARLMDGERADIVADPPYGTGMAQDAVLGNSKIPFFVPGDQDTAIARKAWQVWKAIGRVQVWWGANYYADELPPSSCWLVWDKDHHGMTFADGELAWCNVAMPVRFFRHAWSGADRDSEKGVERDHPNQKPIALFEWCYQVARVGDVVADPFAGAGASLIAAHRTGRAWRGFEITPKYADVILRRAEAEQLECERVE
jgi:hypothetical protein